MAYKLSAYKLYQSAFSIADVLDTFIEDAPTVGFTSDQVVAFRALAQALADSLSDVNSQLDDRRHNWLEVKTLLKHCTAILREHFDPFMRVNARFYPDLAASYNLQRNGKRTKRKPVTEETGEISGTITNAETEETLANVTVTIADFNLVTQTDDDGNYLFDELPTSVCRVSCSVPNYEVPFDQTVSVIISETMIVDFALFPVQPSAIVSLN